MAHRTFPTLALGFLALLSATQARAEEPGAVRGLRIEIGAMAQPVDADARLALTVTFRNLGAETLHVYQPLHATLVPFPRWTFTSESWGTFVPHGAPFQSMFRKGLQGEILRLVPGASHAHTLRVSTFRKLDASGKASGDPQPLPPGSYMVGARYVRPTTQVPYAETMGRTIRRAHEGLWTGDVSAEPVSLTVKARERPVLSLDAPKDLASGAAVPLRITLMNHSKEALRGRAALAIAVGTKAYGSCFARFLVTGDGLLPVPKPGATNTIDLGAGESLTRTVDLAAIDMRMVRQLGWHAAHEQLDVGFHDVISEGSFRITAHLMDELGNTIAEGGIRRSLRPLVLREDVLEVRLERRGLDHGRVPVVEVIIANRGTEPVRLPAALHYPANVFFSLETAGKRGTYRLTQVASGRLGRVLRPDEPGHRARIAEGLAWKLGACEQRGPQRGATSVLLPPGGELRRRFRLAELVDAGELLEWGPFQLTAYYRNRESGARMGLEDFFVGLVAAKPVEVRAGGW